jgi:hypothetical protein
MQRANLNASAPTPGVLPVPEPGGFDDPQPAAINAIAAAGIAAIRSELDIEPVSHSSFAEASRVVENRR